MSGPGCAKHEPKECRAVYVPQEQHTLRTQFISLWRKEWRVANLRLSRGCAATQPNPQSGMMGSKAEKEGGLHAGLASA